MCLRRILMFLGICTVCSSGYGYDSLPDAPASAPPVTAKRLPLAILEDQIPIWTSPVRIRAHDLTWLLPIAAAAGTTLATDTSTMRAVSRDHTFNKDSVNSSNALLATELAVPAILYGAGLIQQKDGARETGLVSGEAIVDSVIFEEVAKISFRRERPLTNNAAGSFFSKGIGTQSSFPSSHSILAWTTAAVVAGEYSSKWVQVGVYTAATGVSLTRVLGQEHFPTDVLVGAAAGWLVGHYVFTHHSRIARALVNPEKSD
jgi:membrane-associated phospholipid phosphatase